MNYGKLYQVAEFKDETVDNIPEVIVVSNRNKENKPKWGSITGL